jgi:Flp pilus assembly protein TadG
MHSILRRPGTTVRRHLATRTRGQSLVEFALILPLFLVFVAACLDLGRVFYANISLNNAAREGAMQASSKNGSFIQDGACDPVNNAVVCRVQLESKGSSVAIASTDISRTCSITLPTPCPRAAGSTATVTVRGTFRLVTPLLSFVFGSQNLNLTSSATAQIEYLPQIATSTAPPAPTSDFTWNPSSPLAGDSVTFDPSTSTGDPTGWQWDFNGDAIADSTIETPTYVFAAAGTYTVSLTVVNLTGVAVKQHDVVVTAVAGPPPPPPPPPPPTCTYPPNVIGQVPGTASALILGAGFAYLPYNDLTTGTKDRIQAQNPDHTQCLPAGTQITVHYRPA